MYFWIVIISIAVLILAVLVFDRKANEAFNRSSASRCLNCGYDLRATRDLCPECGTKPLRRLERAKLEQFPAHEARTTADESEFKGVTDEQLTSVVHETTEREEARLVVVQLETRNIAARYIFTDLTGQPFLTLFQVCVLENQKALAEEIIRQFEHDQPPRCAG